MRFVRTIPEWGAGWSEIFLSPTNACSRFVFAQESKSTMSDAGSEESRSLEMADVYGKDDESEVAIKITAKLDAMEAKPMEELL